jgi:hypothetical protein
MLMGGYIELVILTDPTVFFSRVGFMLCTVLIVAIGIETKCPTRRLLLE